MAELTQKERLQPSLLDRLTDDAPHEVLEARDQRVLGIQKLRECVLRDLAWLLNTENLDSVVDLSGASEVKNSVVNFGIPPTAGNTASGINIAALERRVREAIVAFEPRILKDTLQVRGVSTYESMGRKALTFEINGELWAQPVPLRLYLRTELDLETGKVSIKKAQ